MRHVWIVLCIACLAIAQAQVNRLAVLPFGLKEQGQAADSKVAAILVNDIRESLARSKFFTMVSNDDIPDLVAALKNPADVSSLASKTDYVVTGDVVFFADGVKLGVQAQLLRTAENRPLKSAAANGNKLDIKGMVKLLLAKLSPTREEVLQEAVAAYHKAYQAGEFVRAVAYCDWALAVAPQSWEYLAQRGKAYHAVDDVLRAEQDYQQAMKFSDGRADLEPALNKIRPRISQLRGERKKSFDAITQKLEEWRHDGTVRRIGLLAQLLRELLPQAKEPEKTQALVRHADTMSAALQTIEQELARIRQQETSREMLQKLAAIDKQLGQIAAHYRKIADFVAENFADASQTYFTDAMDLYKKDRFDDALAALEKTLLLKPQAAKAYYWRALVLGKERDYTNAIDSFSKAIELHATYWEAYYNRALTYQQTNDVGSARKDLEAVIRIKPEFADTYLALGDLCAGQQDNEQAFLHYNKAIQLDDKLMPAYLHRGKLYDQAQEYVKARNDYKRALELAPQLRNKIEPLLTKTVVLLDKDALVYADRGRACLETGELVAAMAYLNKALEMNPDHAWSYFRRGWIYQSWQQYDKATSEYNEAISLKRSEPQFYFQRAIVHQYLGQHAKALADLQIVLNFNNFSHAAYHRQGLVYAAQKDYYKAVESYQKAIKIASNVPQYFADLADAYTQLKQSGAANVYWMQARELSK